MNDFGNIAVFSLIFIESLFPPIPSELIDIYSYVIYGILMLALLFVIYKLIQRQRSNEA